MTEYVSDVAFTPSVKSLQSAAGSRAGYEAVAQRNDWSTEVTPLLSDFLKNTDMFYFGTANLEGQPYIQYRGGPKGFLKVIDNKTLAFADFTGNKQYISAGNLIENPKAFIFLIDYENRRRLKIWGEAKVVEDDLELRDSLIETSYKAFPERVILFEITAHCNNCPQHIHQRIPKEKVDFEITKLKTRIRQLETELAKSKECIKNISSC